MNKKHKRNHMNQEFMEEICSLADYEVYLANKYDFRPFDYNTNEVWENVIKRESRGKNSVWYKKFIKKYYRKQLLPEQYLKKALIIAGCKEDDVAEVIHRNNPKEIVHFFMKIRKKRKIRCFYKGN